MQKRKLVLTLLATMGVLAAAFAYAAQRAQVFPGRNLFRGVVIQKDFEYWGAMMRFYVHEDYQPNVDRTYSVAVVENASKGLVPLCTDDLNFCITVEAEAAAWVHVKDASGNLLYKSINYGVATSGWLTYTYAILPPPAVAAQGKVFSYIILPLLNADGSPKSWTPWLSEWVFTNF